MGEHSGGGDQGGGPVFVDIYGTANRLGLDKKAAHGHGAHGFEGPHPDGPLWRRGLRGELPLWLAFWGCFFFGHGIVMAFSIGSMIIGTIFGLVLDPTGLDDSMIAARLVAGAIGIAMTVFVVWATICVWRSAPKAGVRKWGIAARVVVVVYVAGWSMAIWKVVS
ncbi:MAG: hypothetical protein WD075_04605 [Rhodospirillales bacterium]